MKDQSEELINKTIGITGGSGFIGHCLIRRLLREPNINVAGFVHSEMKAKTLKDWNIELTVGDIQNEAQLTNFIQGKDVVIHTAAKLGHGPWQEFMDVNVHSTGKLAEVCVAAGVKRLVYISSIEVYGNFSGRELDESVETVLCGHPYADSKILAERILWEKLKNTPTEGVVVRPGMVFGPESEFWTARLLNLARQGKFLIVDGGKGSIFPIYIDDLVEGIILATTHPAAVNGTFNFVNQEPKCWSDWAIYYRKISGNDHAIIDLPAWVLKLYSRFSELLTGNGHNRRLEILTRKARISNQHTKDLLGWTPTIGYNEGMRRGEQWLREAGYLPGE
jgi:nucleoside-diphosphate-sugar epimerase